MLFDCSRTIVREALTRLAARGIVTVSARRGWYVIEPSQDEAREAFEARRVIETGLIRSAGRIDKAALTRAARRTCSARRPRCKGNDVGTRSFLLGDFHVCLAECLGNSLLADTLRDFTARTTLIAMLYQSSHDAAQSCEDHVHIVAALERGDTAARRGADGRAHRHRADRPCSVQAQADPLAQLRDALAPLHGTPPGAKAKAQLLRSRGKPDPGLRATPSPPILRLT